jgi:hypothetical protein
MAALAAELRALVAHCTPLLAAIPPDVARAPTAPGKWSRQQILGHLIDSAGNNQQKFVRLLTANGSLAFAGYAQDAWVDAQHYQLASWDVLVRLWAAFNEHLAHVIEHADERRLEATLVLDGRAPITLRFAMTDYVAHCRHHLRVVLPGAGIDGAHPA